MPSSNKYIYLDSAASASDSRFYVRDDFANPNSVHDAGRDSFAVLEGARTYIAKTINAKIPSEIIFTSGATESNNMAIFGIARAAKLSKSLDKNTKPKVIISATEHESVLLPALELKNEGFEVMQCPVDNNGFVKLDKLTQLVDKNTVLVSVNMSSTEIGTIQDLTEISKIVHSCGAYFHSDCVGSFGRTNIDVQSLGLDSISFAGHKIGTPKGIGCMYLKANTPCKPLFYGSGQENGLRGGTQNVAMAASMQMATQYCMERLDSLNKHYCELRSFVIEQLRYIDGVNLTVDYESYPDKFLPNIMHLLFDNFSSDTLILHYGKYNISLSGGPACCANDKEPSHVLKAIGIENNKINNSVRISFTSKTTIEDLKVFIQATKDLISR